MGNPAPGANGHGAKPGESPADAPLIDALGWVAAAEARLGPFDAYARDYAEQVARLREAWLGAHEARQDARRLRRQGRGRRPSLRLIKELAKRAGLDWITFDAARQNLEVMAKGNGQPPSLGTLVAAARERPA